MSDEADVLFANESFYEAFSVGSIAAMDAVWARGEPVACIHPGWAALVGRARVMASWKAIFESGAPEIECDAAEAHVLGDVAFVTCTELVDGGQLVATNLFAREDGDWRMVHHHAGPVAATERPRRRASTDTGPN